MHILMIGMGYVGLTSALCFARKGHQVICLDIDEEKIENLKNGTLTIYEPGLKELLQENLLAERLLFLTSYREAVQKANICFIAVPTPSLKDGACDVSYVLHAASEIARHMQEQKTIVIKSTVPVGCAQEIKKHIQLILNERHSDLRFQVISNPEFLREGSAIHDFMKPDRILIGVSDAQSEKIMREIYAFEDALQEVPPFVVTDTTSAELTKYAANAMLATRISFMNELSQVCEKVGANINQVRIGIGSDPRIGHQFLYAGAGYGGSCFPKDIRAFLSLAKSFGLHLSLLEAVELINERQKKLLGNKILSYFSERGGIQDKTIGIWGLSFKPETDDMREAPALILIEMLLAEGAQLRVFDPVAITNAKKILKGKRGITFCQDEYEAAAAANALVLVTEWRQLRSVDFDKIGALMDERVFFDGRNQFSAQEMLKKGFSYFGIGVPPLHKELADLLVTQEVGGEENETQWT